MNYYRYCSLSQLKNIQKNSNELIEECKIILEINDKLMYNYNENSREYCILDEQQCKLIEKLYQESNIIQNINTEIGNIYIENKILIQNIFMYENDIVDDNR